MVSSSVIPYEPYLIDTDNLFDFEATDWTNITGLVGVDTPSFYIEITSGVGPLSIADNLLSKTTLIPNPVSNYFEISTPKDIKIESVKVLNVLGESIKISENK